LLFVISFLIFLSSCIKDPVSSCKQENTLVQVKQYDAIECPYDEFNFLIKSEKQRDSIFKKYSCFTSMILLQVKCRKMSLHFFFIVSWKL
jgi:hypothetical protein